MKTIFLALLAVASGHKLTSRYAESEGPTKVDLGENDNDVLARNGNEQYGNPLGYNDSGASDDTVVLQTDGTAIVLHRVKREIYDEDGDGVEDNVQKTRDELDRFYVPNRYFPTEDIFNTHHGNMPGHTRKEEYEGVPTYNPFYAVTQKVTDS